MGAQHCDDSARRGNGAHSCATLARRVCAKWAHSAAMVLRGAGNGAHSCATLARRACAKWAHSAAIVLRGAEMGRTAVQRWRGGRVRNGRTALRLFCAAREMGRSSNSSWHRQRKWGARARHGAVYARVGALRLRSWLWLRCAAWACGRRQCAVQTSLRCVKVGARCVSAGSSVQVGRVDSPQQAVPRHGRAGCKRQRGLRRQHCRKRGAPAWLEGCAFTWWCAKVTVMVMVTVRRVRLRAQAMLAPARRWSGEKMRATREGNTLDCW